MMKAMISQPMAGKTDEEIRAEHDSLKRNLESRGFEVVDTVFDIDAPPKEAPLRYMAKRIEAMAGCDAVVFTPGWQRARGCLAERVIVDMYGLKAIYVLN